MPDAYDFHLPPDRIAHTPVRPRDSARLLHIGKELTDHRVHDLPGLLREGDLLVANDTRVIPAQLEARRNEARIGLTLDQPRAGNAWHALARNARRLRSGDTLTFDKDPTLTAEILETHEGGSVTLRFNADPTAAAALALPPYINRPEGPTPEDQSDYQTLFAAHPGAVAAPTAALHFTPALRDALAARGIATTTVTLHVGAGTFLPMRGHPDDHAMHAERGHITPEAADTINRATRIVAIGTTTLRLLESAADDQGRVHPFDADTALFIRPGHRFRTAHALLTNFHLPKSTLFMLTCAFAGTQRMQAAYAHAIATGYRFYSYGDSSLIERA